MTQAERNRHAFAALARTNPDLLPEGSVIVVVGRKATLMVDETTGMPATMKDIILLAIERHEAGKEGGQ